MHNEFVPSKKHFGCGGEMREEFKCEDKCISRQASAIRGSQIGQ
jgi:hypothetical protein